MPATDSAIAAGRLAAARASAKTWERLGGLRVLRPARWSPHLPSHDRIQQEWHCRETGETEWRDVHVELDYSNER